MATKQNKTAKAPTASGALLASISIDVQKLDTDAKIQAAYRQVNGAMSTPLAAVIWVAVRAAGRRVQAERDAGNIKAPPNELPKLMRKSLDALLKSWRGDDEECATSKQYRASIAAAWKAGVDVGAGQKVAGLREAAREAKAGKAPHHNTGSGTGGKKEKDNTVAALNALTLPAECTPVFVDLHNMIAKADQEGKALSMLQALRWYGETWLKTNLTGDAGKMAPSMEVSPDPETTEQAKPTTAKKAKKPKATAPAIPAPPTPPAEAPAEGSPESSETVVAQAA